MKLMRTALLMVAGAMLATACAPNPKYIAASTARTGDVKFLYVKREGGQGVIRCQRAADGALTDCRRVAVVLQGE